MTGLRRLIDTILTPSPRGEDGYTWAVIGLGHVMLGAMLQGLLGWAGAGLRLAIAAATGSPRSAATFGAGAACATA